MDEVLNDSQAAPITQPPVVAALAPAIAAMVTFMPALSFTGYPDGVTPVHFTAGEESSPVSPDFAQLMLAKGLVADEKTTNETV